jgi:hypothetical protein
MIMVVGCRGPEGPTGPTGADGQAGPGEQTTYLFRVVPTAASDTKYYLCPEIVANNTTGLYSTVTCYLVFDGYTDAVMVPFEDTETDATITRYFSSIDTQTLTLGWVNSATTVPGVAFDLVVTVVNP